MKQLFSLNNSVLCFGRGLVSCYWNRHAQLRKSFVSDICVRIRNGMATSGATVSRLYELATKFNRFYLFGLQKGDCRPFVIEGYQVGLIRPDMLKNLLKFPEVFHVQADAVELNPAFRDYDERTARLDIVLRECRDSNLFLPLKGWRDECYEVRAAYSDPPLLQMERSAFSIFGIRKYGVDINGYVNHPELGLCVWLQRRSPTKDTWPGKWDNMVSGGLSVGNSILETAVKEAYEEASIPSTLSHNVRPAGSISIFFESERGLFPNTEFVFDLELPKDFTPRNNDGEVDRFELLPIDKAIERVLTPDFKTTSAAVFIDFLVRHGRISPETGREFPQLVELLHVPLQSLYSRQPRSANGRSDGDHS